jgi:hypothetical protein
MARWARAQHDGLLFDDLGNGEGKTVAKAHPAPRYQADTIARSEPLPFWMYPVGVVVIEADEILQRLVAVQAATVLAHLHQPRPHRVRRRVDPHRFRRPDDGLIEQLVAG